MEDEEQDQDQVQEQDPFAFILEDCLNSSSQEELFTHVKIAREDDKFSDDDYSPELKDSGESHRKLDGGCELIEGEFVANDAELKEAGILGFRGEENGETSGTKLVGFCDEEREIELELKKCEVSTVVDRSGKVVIEGEDDGEEIGMFEGDLEVEKVSALRSDDRRGSGDCGENLGCEGDMEGGSKRKLEFEVIGVGEEEDEMMMKKKKKLEAVVDNEVIIEDDEEEREGSGNAEDSRKRGDGTISSSMREEKRRKRELPRSMFGLVWGEGNGDRDRIVGNRSEEKKEEEQVLCDEGSGDANRNAVIRNEHLENGLEEANAERNRDGIEEDKTRSVLDVLRFLAKEKSINDGGKIDHVETVQQRGLTFPRSRFLPEEVEDDDDEDDDDDDDEEEEEEEEEEDE